MEIGGDRGALGLEYLDQQSVGSSGYGVGGGRLASDARDRNTLCAGVRRGIPVRRWRGGRQVHRPMTLACEPFDGVRMVETSVFGRLNSRIDRGGRLGQPCADRLDLDGRQRTQRMDAHEQRDPLTVVEHWCGDGDHGLRLAYGVVVGQEADGGEFGEQLLQDLLCTGRETVPAQRTDQVRVLRQNRCGPVDIESALAGTGEDPLEAPLDRGVGGRGAPDPRTLFVGGVPCGEGDTERRSVGDPVSRNASALGRVAAFDRGDHQRVVDALDHRGWVADGAADGERRSACGVRQRPRGIGVRRHHRQRGPQPVGLVDGITAGPATIAQRLQDRVGSALGEAEFARDIGKPQPGSTGPRQQLDDIECPGCRGRGCSRNGLDSSSPQYIAFIEFSKDYL